MYRQRNKKTGWEGETWYISGHKARSVFDRYNVTSEDDLKSACEKLSEAYERAKEILDWHNPGIIELRKRG